MNEIEKINQKFKTENAALELLRNKSNNNANIAKFVTLSYAIITFISIPFGNGFTILLFIGFIPLIIFINKATIKRTNFEKELEKIQPKYINLLVNSLGSKVNYNENGSENLVEESLFFNTTLKGFSTSCKHQVELADNGDSLNALNIDFAHKKYKNSLIDFYWRKSMLICLSCETGMVGKNLLIPKSYFYSNNEDGPKLFNRIMPLKKLKHKLDFDKASLFSGYTLFSETKREKLTLPEDLQLKIINVLKSFCVKEKKFLSITEDKIFILIFDAALFKPNLKKSLADYDIINEYNAEIEQLKSAFELMYTSPNKT